MRHTVFAFLAFASVAATVSAQTTVRPTAVPAPVYRGTFDAASGTLLPAASGTFGPGSPPADVLYRNDVSWMMSYDLVAGGTTVVDEGRIPNATSGGTLNSYTVSHLQLGYATDATDPSLGGAGASATISIFDAYVPCTNPAYSPQPVATFSLTGLPGSLSGSIESICVDVALPSTICMRGDGDGTFDDRLDGFGWSISTSMTTGYMGPLVSGNPFLAREGAGTFYFPAVPPAGGTGLSTLDLFYEIDASGERCAWFGGLMNSMPFASFHLLLFGDSATECFGCGIADDRLEPNDACTTAPELASPGFYAGLLADGGNSDFHRVTVPAGQEVVATALFSHSIADLDMRLYVSPNCGTLMDSSMTASDEEQVRYLNGGAMPIEVLVEVFEVSGAGCGTYSLDLLMCDGAPPCTDDALEPNDDCATALPLPVGTTSGLVVFDCDEDYFTVALAAGDTLRVDAMFSHATADVDLYLYPAGVQACGFTPLFGWIVRGTSKTDNETLTFTNMGTSTMDLIVKVDHFAGQSCTTYDLVVCQQPSVVGRSICSGIVNSTGVAATLCTTGSDVAMANNLTAGVDDLPQNSFGYFLTAPDPVFTTFNPGGSTGDLCINGPLIGRYVMNIVNSGSSGAVALVLDLPTTPSSTGNVAVSSGDVRYWQYWYRDADAMGNATSNFSNAVLIEFD